jgi:hypothetical protein
MSSMDGPIDEGEPSYRPLMSEQRAERIRQWHEGAYRRARDIADGDHTFSYLGRTLVVMPQVMPITPMSDLLGEAVLAEVKDGDRVLDMGTGSGVNAVLAASEAAEVLAVDINPARPRGRPRQHPAQRCRRPRRSPPQRCLQRCRRHVRPDCFRPAVSLVCPSRLARSRHHG